MGMISPKKLSTVSKALITLLLISLSPLLIAVVLVYFLWGAVLYIAIWLLWGKQLLMFVYSDSPTWKDYIEKEILPYIRDRAVILNWSDRRNWKSSVSVFAFRYFAGYRNFNPIALLFRPFRFVKAYRFFEPFHQFKHGDPAKVENLRKRLFDDLGI